MNAVLQEAHDDPSVNNQWWYLPDSLSLQRSAAAKTRRDRPNRNPYPLGPSFSLAFLGKRLEDVTKRLQGKQPKRRPRRPFLWRLRQGSDKVEQGCYLPAQ